MRLTLRTLLAYLDDTLEPAEAKLIGEKVAESDVAPELIERIKKVTRRRGLAAPPVTGDEDDAASDPNTVAEYIDNALPSEQIDDVEAAALASDSHLAEISACHQILTLVLGEPARVPPTARQRMYRLIKGHESIPYRKAASTNLVAGVADPDRAEENSEADEALLLGMTSTRMLAPIATAILILLLLVGVIMLAIPPTPAPASHGYIALNNTGDSKQGDGKTELQKKREAYEQHVQRGRTSFAAKNWEAAAEEFKAAQSLFPGDVTTAQLIKDVAKAKNDADTTTRLLALVERARTAIKAAKFDDAETALADAGKIDASHAEVKKALQELADARKAFVAKKPIDPTIAELGPMPREANGQPLITPKNNPDADRRPIATLVTRETLVLSRRRDTDIWERVDALKELNTADTVMALPGNRAELRLDNGIVLTLWGSLPQYQTIPVLDLQESRIVPHVPPQGFDADFTLESGRVFITRPVAKDKPATPVKVRVRFKDEVWEITLIDAEAEVCVDLLSFYPEGVPFAKDRDGMPKAEFYFGLLKGKAGLKVKFKEYPMLQAPMHADWDNIGGQFSTPERIRAEDMEWWNKAIPDHEGAKQMQAAAAYFVDRVKKSEASLETIFNSAMKDDTEQANRRVYAVHCLQAIDSISFLADALDSAEPPEIRERSSFIVRAVGIRCVQHWTGLSPERDLKFYRLLSEKKGYSEGEAQMVMQLLHPFTAGEIRKTEIVQALFDAMRHEKLAVRELAYMHLSMADPAGAKEIGFLDVSIPEQARDPRIAEWKASYKKRIIDKKKK